LFRYQDLEADFIQVQIWADIFLAPDQLLGYDNIDMSDFRSQCASGCPFYVAEQNQFYAQSELDFDQSEFPTLGVGQWTEPTNLEGKIAVDVSGYDWVDEIQFSIYALQGQGSVTYGDSYPYCEM
jgi:hypothetical protein